MVVLWVGGQEEKWEELMERLLVWVGWYCVLYDQSRCIKKDRTLVIPP